VQCWFEGLGGLAIPKIFFVREESILAEGAAPELGGAAAFLDHAIGFLLMQATLELGPGRSRPLPNPESR
jgi:hypothetical protein